uniref:Chitin-binding type-2 domain-containing protein n=1 Tax=Stomoxys calcitrans TaxID=35570 RepID=A0A1I8QAT7_STOCA
MWRIAVLLMIFCLTPTFAGIYTKRTIHSRQQEFIQSRETSTCDGRQSPGPICESCDLLATCVKHSTGWVNIPVETCDTQNGFYCNSLLGRCSNDTGPCHPFSSEGNFPCTSHGIFPDPYDCQKYHMCYFVGPTLVSASVECGGDKAFNPATGQCSLTLSHAICQQQQYVCHNAGDAKAWPLSSNIFYICKASSNQDERILYPTLYRCDDGEVFDGYYCRPGTSMGELPNLPTPLIPGNPGNPGNPPIGQMSTTTMKPGVVETTSKPRVCPQVGLFADTDDCRKYYYCSAINGQLKEMQCPLGTVFNEDLSSCTLGDC